MADALDALPRDYVELTASLPPGRRGGELVTGSREAPLPLRLDALNLAHEIAATLCDLEDSLRRVLGFVPAGRLSMVWRALAASGAVLYQGPDRAEAERAVEGHEGGRVSWLRLRAATEPLRRDALHHPAEGRQLDAAARFLHQALPQLLDGPAGADSGLEILDLHSRARITLGLTRGDVPLPVPCPNLECRQRALVRRNGTMHVECDRRRGGCGKIIGGGDKAGDAPGRRSMQWLVRVLAVDMPDLLLPSARVADLCGVTRSAVSKWAERGRLVPAACQVTGKQAPLYRAGDVLVLAAGGQQTGA